LYLAGIALSYYYSYVLATEFGHKGVYATFLTLPIAANACKMQLENKEETSEFTAMF